MTTFRRLLLFGLSLFVLAGPARAQSNELGEISFPTSASPEAQEHFLQGVLLLHSFEYEDAREAFLEAQEVDPAFAMAYWGEAMTHNHPVWNQRDRGEGLAALERLALEPAERAANAPTQREKEYLQAVEVLYAAGEKPERDRAYAEAMRRLTEQYPDDLEAAAFYALALLGTTQGERDFRTYMQAAAVAEEVFAKNRRHPGAVHYLIHAYDDPIHAPLGLRPARVYADIAPAAAHALHMPSHIFVALGMWDDVVASNEASWAAAEERVRRKNLSVDDRGFHAFWWLLYGYLQQGRVEEARLLLESMERDATRSRSVRTRWHFAAMRAAYVIDAQDCTGELAQRPLNLSDLGPRGVATDRFITGWCAVQQDDWMLAEKSIADLKSARDAAPQESDQQAAEIMARELEALLFMREGKTVDAFERLDEAAEVEDAMRYDFGPPYPVKPVHELYGELLLTLNQYEEAQAQFEKALARTPRRPQALLGLARAAEGSGDVDATQEARQELAAIWHRADPTLPALQEVTDALDPADGR